MWFSEYGVRHLRTFCVHRIMTNIDKLLFVTETKGTRISLGGRGEETTHFLKCG